MLKVNILDTFIFLNSEIFLKNYHIQRTQEAFQFLNCKVDKEIENFYTTIEKNYVDNVQPDECLRIVFSSAAPLKYSIEIKKITLLNAEIKLSAVFSKKQTSQASRFKWENRENWNPLLLQKKNEADDILLINEDHELVETSRFNIFCYDKINGIVMTPELTSGCLNGTLRRYYLDLGSIKLPKIGNLKIIEKKIKFEELSHYQLFVGNSVRKLLRAQLI